jgi:hypothetical protein
MTYTAEQTRKFFAKKIFDNLEGARREGRVDAALEGISQGIVEYRVKYGDISPRIMMRMLNVYDTEKSFLDSERLVRFTHHPSTGARGSILIDASRVILLENDEGAVIIMATDDPTGRAWLIEESMEEATKAVNLAIAKGSK